MQKNHFFFGFQVEIVVENKVKERVTISKDLK